MALNVHAITDSDVGRLFPSFHRTNPVRTRTQAADSNALLYSITANPALSKKSIEEIRCEDYEKGRKGGSLSMNNSGGGTASGGGSTTADSGNTASNVPRRRLSTRKSGGGTASGGGSTTAFPLGSATKTTAQTTNCSNADCGNTASYACSRCGTAFYCSKACQKRHWSSEHKKYCTPQMKK